METKIIIGLGLWLIAILVGIYNIVRHRRRQFLSDWKGELLLGITVMFFLSGWGVLVYGPAELWIKMLHLFSSFEISFPRG